MGFINPMRTKSSHLAFRATPQLKADVEAAAAAQGLKAGEWMHAVVEKAVNRGVMVRQHVTYEVIEPKPVLRVAEKRRG
jgi:hypothetical protein